MLYRLIKANGCIPRKLLNKFTKELDIPNSIVAAMWWLHLDITTQVVVKGQLGSNI